MLYYACSYAKADSSKFMNTTAGIALKLIPEKLRPQPVFLCIDDTMVSKFGKKFEDVSKLFDHAAHNGSNYLNGHCFVSVMLCVPVWNKSKIHYLSVPLGYRMWQKKESKLELAASMIRQAMPQFRGRKNVRMQGLTLPFMTCRRNEPEKESGSRRLFFSTIFPEQLEIFCAWQEKSPLNQTGSDRMQFLPLLLYVFRWNIEVSYYEQKTFWSLCGYIVRSRKGIEMRVNLINITYCAMKLLLYQDEAFSKYQTESVQEFRFALSEQIRQQGYYL